jgi:hypothetical protein
MRITFTVFGCVSFAVALLLWLDSDGFSTGELSAEDTAGLLKAGVSALVGIGWMVAAAAYRPEQSPYRPPAAYPPAAYPPAAYPPAPAQTIPLPAPSIPATPAPSPSPAMPGSAAVFPQPSQPGFYPDQRS